LQYINILKLKQELLKTLSQTISELKGVKNKNAEIISIPALKNS